MILHVQPLHAREWLTFWLSFLDAGTDQTTAKASNHPTVSCPGAEGGLPHPSVLPKDTACWAQEDLKRRDAQCRFWGASQQIYPAPAGSSRRGQSKQVQVGAFVSGEEGGVRISGFVLV